MMGISRANLTHTDNSKLQWCLVTSDVTAHAHLIDFEVHSTSATASCGKRHNIQCLKSRWVTSCKHAINAQSRGQFVPLVLNLMNTLYFAGSIRGMLSQNVAFFAHSHVVMPGHDGFQVFALITEGLSTKRENELKP
jgi:hypothetical protein